MQLINSLDNAARTALSARERCAAFYAAQRGEETWVTSPLRRGNMECDAWREKVEGEAKRLAAELSKLLGQDLLGEVHWHGHAEVLIVPSGAMTARIHPAGEDGEGAWVERLDAVLRVWVD